MTLQDNDKFLVDREEIPYSVEAVSLTTSLEDTDLMLVCRDGVPYKATGEEIKNSLGSPNINPGDNDFIFNPAPESGTGTQADPYILKGKTADPWGASLQTDETITIIGQPPETSVVWTDNSVDAGTRFAQVSGETTDANGTWSGKLDYADIPESTETTTYVGNLNIGLVYFRWTVVQTEITDEPTSVTNVSLIDSAPGEGPRFTSQSFVASSQVVDGLPISTKTIDAHVDGTLSRQVKFDEPLESSIVDTSGTWNAASATEANGWASVTYGDGKFVAVSYTGTNRVMYSTDGVNWTSALTEANGWASVTYGDGKFVAVAPDMAMYSTDGIVWSTWNTPENNSWYSVTYGNGTFVAVSYDGTNRVMYSTDGQNWTSTTPPEVKAWYSVTYGNGTFVAVSADGAVMYSTDGISWTATSAPEPTNQWYGVTYGNGKFVAVAYNGNNLVMYSTDGINWTSAASAEGANGWMGVTYGDDKFVAVSVNNQVMYSTDGISWTLTAAPGAAGSNAWRSVVYGNDKFVAVGDSGGTRAMWSLTGTGLIADLTFAADADMEGLAGGDTVNQTYRPVTDASTSVTPTVEGANAVETDFGLTNVTWMCPAALTNQVLVMGKFTNGTEGICTATCSDGVNWEVNPGPYVNQTNWESVFGCGDKYILTGGRTGSGNAAFYSLNGKDWSSTSGVNATPGNSKTTSGAVFGNGVYLIYGYNFSDGMVWTSSNGASFTESKPSGIGQISANSCIFDGSKFIINTWDCNATSTDGVNWTKNNNGLGSNYITGYDGIGTYIGVYSDSQSGFRPITSSDGINWTDTVGSGDCPRGVKNLVYGNGCWLATGNNGKWYSEDNGVTWSNPNQWGARSCFSEGLGVFASNSNSPAIGGVIGPSAFAERTLTTITFASDKELDLFQAGDNAVTPDSSSAPIQSIDIGANQMVTTGALPLTVGEVVTTGDKTTTGTVSGVVDTTATLSSSSGPWVDSKDVTGPQKTIVEENARLYCAFDSSGNITDLQNDPQDPPYTTQDSNPGLTLTFPATFPSGQTPDEELTDGTTLTVEVTAENSSSTSGPVSATVQPEPATPTAPLAGLTTLYTGVSTALTITNGIDNLNNGGLLWIKNRDNTRNNVLFDTERTADSVLVSNDSGARALIDPPIVWNDNGFTLPYGDGDFNSGGFGNYVAWNFGKAAGYFDVVKFTTSNATTFQTVPHSLGTMPGLIITKEIGGEGDWYCYHSAIGDGGYVTLNTNAPSTSYDLWRTSDTDFQLNSATLYGDRNEVIAYLFAEDTAGVIKCGFNATPGTQVELGFEPQWVLIKREDDSSNWVICDNKRHPNNGSNQTIALNPNDPRPESDIGVIVFNSTGFTQGFDYNCIYVAIAAPPVARSQTDEEFIETTAKFISYDNRKQVKQGEEALEDRETLQEELKKNGLSLAQITELFND